MLRYILVLFIPLLTHGERVSRIRWPSLKTTFPLFDERPTNRAAAAVKAGWKLLDACNGGQWLGERYALESDPSVVLIFDRAGFIAGIQNVILVSAVNTTIQPNIRSFPLYQLGDFFGRPSYFTTAYFVDPSLICGKGRDVLTAQIQGVGDRLLFQTGPSPRSLLPAPLTQTEADQDPAWFDHNCVPGMGDHYVQFGYNRGDSCAGLPLLLLYDQGHLHGFGFAHYSNLPGPKWERPTARQLSVSFPKKPACLDEIADASQLSTMHIYFARLPSVVVCPLNPTLDKLGALTNELLRGVPPKGTPFPKINGPKKDDKVCIVGAGPTGMHMAASLKKKGIKKLVVYEATGRVGGKNLDLTLNGVTHNYMALGPSYFKTFLPLAKEYGSGALNKINWANVFLDGTNKKITLQKYITASVVNATGVSPTEVIPRLMEDARKYDVIRKEMFGSVLDFLPQRPSAQVLFRLRGTGQDFLSREGLQSLRPIFKLLISLPGYGYLDEIAALYVVMWLSPLSVVIFIDSLIGISRPPLALYSLKDGFEQVWEGIAKKEQLDIRFNTPIQSVVRLPGGVALGFWKDEVVSAPDPLTDRAAVLCDFLVWAAPAAQLNIALKNKSYKERELLSSIQHNIHTSAWVNMKNDIRNGPLSAYQGTLDRNIENGVHYDISVEGWQVPGILKPEITEAWNRNNSQTITKVVGCVAQKSSNEAVVKDSIRAHYTDLNATDIEFLDIATWKYFPRWSPEIVGTGAHWDLFDLQGKGKMWYAGSSFSFESVYSVLEYNNLLIKQAGL